MASSRPNGPALSRRPPLPDYDEMCARRSAPTPLDCTVRPRQQRSQPPPERANDESPEEEDTTCGHAEHHGERREAGVRLRDAGRQGPEPAEQAQPAEPGWEPPAEKHRATEGRDGESEEHAEKTRQTDLYLSHRKGAFEGARPSLATCLHPTIDHHLQRHAVDRLQRGGCRNACCRSDDADPSPR